MASTAYELAVQQYVDVLNTEGMRILMECENERGCQHQTHNLHDSYGFGIYHNGKLVKTGFLPQLAREPKKWYKEELEGRDQISSFLKTEHKAGKGLELVIAVAMPYGEVLEKRKYRVIAMANDKLRALSQKYKGSTVSNIYRGKKI